MDNRKIRISLEDKLRAINAKKKGALSDDEIIIKLYGDNQQSIDDIKQN